VFRLPAVVANASTFASVESTSDVSEKFEIVLSGFVDVVNNITVVLGSAVVVVVVRVRLGLYLLLV
jgi:hypothetical protein